MAGALTISTLNNDTGVLATQNGMNGIAKAWVKFTGGSAPSVSSSFNVSSITFSTTGIWLMNFSTPMPDANYCVAATATASGVGGIAIMQNGDGNSANFAYLIGTNTSGNVNWQFVNAVVFR